MTYSYNQTIEYEDCTRDLNFEAAQKWAREHGTSFEEDVTAHKMLGDKLMRFFVIGNEPKTYIPTEDELKAQVRAVRNQYLKQYVDDRAKSPFMWNEVTEEEKALIGEYRKYLMDYPETEGWYEQNPMTFEEWKQASELEQIVASGD